MQILKTLLVVAAVVAPLAVAIPAEARATTDETIYDEPTYTCDIMKAPGTVVFGEGNCVATNGAPTSGLITTKRSFFIAARTDLEQKFRCRGGNFDRPGGNADTPTSVTGNYCS